MKDRDFDPKDGEYLRVMNQFIDKLISYRLDASEWSILMLVIRRTWGVQGRPWAELKWKYIREATRLGQSSLIYAMRKLKARKILDTSKKGQTTSYKINSKVSTWKEEHEIKPFRKKNLGHSSDAKTQVTPVTQNRSLQRPKIGHSSDLVPIKDNIKDKPKDTPHSPPIKMTQKQIIEHDAKRVIDYINQLSGKNFQFVDSNLAPIRARLNEGYTVEQCFQVCKNKWEDPDHQEKYYRPITLFRASLFEGYLNETGTKQKLSKQKTKMRSTVEAFARRHYERENPTKGN